MKQAVATVSLQSCVLHERVLWTAWCNSPVIKSHMGLSDIHLQFPFSCYCTFLFLFLTLNHCLLSFFLSVTPSLSLPDPAVSPLSSSVFPSSSSSPSLFHFRPPSLIFDSDLTLIRSAGSWMFSLQRSLWSSSVKVPSSVIRKLWCDVRVPQKTC